MSKARPLFVDSDLEKVALYGLPTNLRFKPGSNAETLAQFAGSALKLQREFSAEFDRIADDPLLSVAGKSAARRALGEQYLQKLESASFQASPETSAYTRSELLEVASRQRTKRQAELDRASKLSERDSPAEAIRDAYLWDLLRAADPLERPALFHEAIAAGDSATFSAFVRAPRLLKLISPEVLEKGVTAWNERISPEAAREIRELTEAESLLNSAFAEARQFVAEAAGLPGADPLRDLAAGTSAE